jgi:hypothetical protein
MHIYSKIIQKEFPQASMNNQTEKLNINQLREFADKVLDYLIRFPRLRRGQAISNILSDEYPKLAVKIFKEGFDPFYTDGKISNFLKSIATKDAINQLHHRL